MILNELFRIVEAQMPHIPLTQTPQFKSWFGNSKVVDANGNPLPVYHGTSRPDRVGNRFKKSRATAGPMAYFTDSPEIASSYASGKSDTSLEDLESYADWFMVKFKGTRTEVNIIKAWYFLAEAEKVRMTALAPRVTKNDDNEIILDGPERTNGLGGYDYQIKVNRGNVLKTLVDQWLDGGSLYNEEIEFLTVLKLSGMTTPVRFNDPKATYPAVYSVFMKIETPLVTTNIPKSVIEALQKSASKQRAYVGYDTTAWNKSTVDAKQWFLDLLRDVEETGGRLSWTVVPDWATKVLKGFGYDGIQDVGGKHGGGSHTVWIPFEDNQVKSTVSNSGFDSSKNNIHENMSK